MQCPSVERTFCNRLTFKVAVGAGAPTLRFKRIGFRLQVGNVRTCRAVGRPIKITVLKL